MKRKIGVSLTILLAISLLIGSILIYADEVEINTEQPLEIEKTELEDATLLLTDALPTVEEVTEAENLDFVNITAEIISAGIRINWNEIPGADGYELYYRTDDSDWQELYDAKSGLGYSFVDKKVEGGITYYYQGRAYKIIQGEKNIGSYDDEHCFKITYVSIPKLLESSSTDDGLKITWEPVEGATGYCIYWKYPNGSWNRYKTTTETFFIDRNFAKETAYFYTVKAISPEGIKGWHDSKGIGAFYVNGTKITSISNSEKTIDYSWNAVSGVDGYRLYWRNKGEDNWRAFKDVTGTSYRDSGITSGKTYEYLVKPYVIVGSTECFGNVCDADKAVITRLATPKMTTISNMADGIRIEWQAVDQTEKYLVYWRGESGNWKKFAETKNTYFVDKNVNTGVKYYYTIVAVDKDGCRSWHEYPGLASAYVAESRLTSAINEADGILLKWNKVSSADGYRLYWRYPGGSWKSFADVTGTSYLDKGVSFGKTYEYLVRSYVTVGASKYLGHYNDELSISINRMRAPQMIAASNVKDGIKIEWKTVDDAIKYYLYWSTDNKSWKKFAETENTFYVDKAVSTGSKYYYTVAAVNVDGNTSCHANPGIAGVYVPGTQITDASNAENGIFLKWNKVSGATGYRLYWRLPGGSWKRFKDVDGSTQYLDPGVNSNTVYEYLVRPYKTINGEKYLGYYEEEFGKSVLCVGTPELISCKTVKDPNGIKIVWKAVAGASKYNIYGKQFNQAEWVKLDTVTATEYVDTDVTDGKEYCYTVSAIIETEEGEVTGAYSSYGISNSLISTWTMRRLQEAGGTLRGAYDWSVRIPYDGLQPSSSTAAGYALYSFQNQSGDCLGKAATFYYMAKALGYDVKMIQGYVPLRAGGMGIHGWVELYDENSGITYFCDPDFETETGYDGYLRQYRQPGTWRYTDYKELK